MMDAGENLDPRAVAVAWDELSDAARRTLAGIDGCRWRTDLDFFARLGMLRSDPSKYRGGVARITDFGRAVLNHGARMGDL